VTALVAGIVLVPITPAFAAVFTDGFESGTTAAWTQNVGGVTVETAGPFAPAPEGTHYARMTSTGTSAYLQKSISTQSNLYVDTRVNVGSAPNGFTFIRFTTASGTQLVSLKIDKNGKLLIKNHVSGGGPKSATVLTTNAWHELELHASVNGTSSLVEVWLDGTQITALTSTLSLGTTPVGAVQLGTRGAVIGGFDAGFDAVTFDTVRIGGGTPTPPATPTNLHEVSHTSSTASIAWDPVAGATAYGVYRDSVKQGPDIAGTSFNDTGLSASTQYSYTVDAFNSAGRSLQSAPLLVTTDVTPPPPATPTNLHEVSHTSSTASIAWDAVPGATAYGVYRDSVKRGPDITATSFNDTGLSASTQYSYTVDAFNGGGRSLQSAPLLVTTDVAPPPGEDILVRTAGDIACDPLDSNFNNGIGTAKKCKQMATSNLLTGADTVFALGDTQYVCAGTAAFQQAYDPSWGRFKAITWAIPADQEYTTRGGTDCTTGAAGYYAYFGNRGGSTTATPLPGVSQSTIPGVYSFNLPEGCTPGAGGNCTWHIVGLNSECNQVGGCANGDPMETWLEEDLDNNNWSECTAVMFHLPRFSSKLNAAHPINPSLLDLWQDFVTDGVEFVLGGNNHYYERFAPQDALGNADPNGTVQWVVGTGGKSHGKIAPPGSRLPNSETGQDTDYGVLELTLQNGGYAWDYLPIAGSFADTGSRECV
jgi:hypothetical protein